ncbi:Uncharacterized protein Rs2_06846 [Raphanus sativus]|nr:Uncharacterized protein Rs2_06846 [Raphanus sativus]
MVLMCYMCYLAACNWVFHSCKAKTLCYIQIKFIFSLSGSSANLTSSASTVSAADSSRPDQRQRGKYRKEDTMVMFHCAFQSVKKSIQHTSHKLKLHNLICKKIKK